MKVTLNMIKIKKVKKIKVKKEMMKKRDEERTYDQSSPVGLLEFRPFKSHLHRGSILCV